jgi:transposase InsO family protein
MASNNPTWGEERIANELLLKIGIRISPRTVRRYIPDGPRRPNVPPQGWMTFVRNHAKAIIAADFFVVVTATFRFVYVLVVMEIETRRVLHFNVTRHPTAEWTMQQFRECVIGDEGYKSIVHDRDSIYSSEVDSLLRALGLRVLKTPYRAPQANAFCERLIGSVRRECLDFMIPINEDHVRWTMKEWTTHYNKSRPHSSLGPGIPDPNVQKKELQGKRLCIPKDQHVAVTPILGGLHHEYRLQGIAA